MLSMATPDDALDTVANEPQRQRKLNKKNVHKQQKQKQKRKQNVVIGISARQSRLDQMKDYSERKYNESICPRKIKAMRKMHRLS